MKFVLFDIDGTLIDSGGAGTRSLNLAFEEMFDVKDAFKTVSMAGKTDIQIAREGFRLHSVDHENGVIPEFCSLYIKHLASRIKVSRGHIKPGIREIVSVLHADRSIVLGLLTGNIEEGAIIKLKNFGLNEYFAVGAFGSDHEDRNMLLPVAVDKLKKSSSYFISYRDCVIIGDTPLDVRCAKPYGAFSMAVATGPYSYNELSEAGADLVFDDLTDTAGIVSILKKFNDR